MVIAAAEDDTDVNITVSVLNSTTCSDVTLRFRLQAQEVVRVFCDGDMTGSVVNSNKPVAVIAGNICAQVLLDRLTY